jgi:hypothetical protein
MGCCGILMTCLAKAKVAGSRPVSRSSFRISRTLKDGSHPDLSRVPAVRLPDTPCHPGAPNCGSVSSISRRSCEYWSGPSSPLPRPDRRSRGAAARRKSVGSDKGFSVEGPVVVPWDPTPARASDSRLDCGGLSTVMQRKIPVVLTRRAVVPAL